MRTWQVINHLADLGDVDVFCVASGPPVTSAPPRVARWCHAGDNDARSSAQSLVARIRASRWLLSTDGHRDASALRTPVAASALRNLLEQSPPDVVVVEELWLYPFLRELAGWNGILVYDAQNIEGLLRGSLSNASGSIVGRLNQRLLDGRVRAAERSLCRTATAVWVCSDADARVVRDRYGARLPIDVIPNALDLRQYASGHRAFRSCGQPHPFTIFFPAAFGYAPNIAAAELLLREILPRVRVFRPCARLLLAGRSPTRGMLEAAAGDNAIEVTGEVPDIRPYFERADVVVVPLLHGGGTRLKILEAFAMQKPVVSSRKGAEGLDATHETHLLIADTADEFAHALTRLASDESLVSRLTGAAHELLQARYTWEVAGHLVAKSLARITTKRDTVR